MLTLALHHSGFFSTCTYKLNQIVHFFNHHKQLPTHIESTDQFIWYNPHNQITNMTNEYFEQKDDTIEYTHSILYSKINTELEDQFSNYKQFNFEDYAPFIQKYFSPTKQILESIQLIETKYNLLENYANICVLFYRGNDKAKETKLCGYNEFIEKAKHVQLENPDTIFLIQSDETEFIQRMQTEFPRSFYFKDEIRHIPKCMNTVDRINTSQNFKYSKYFLAITIIMSKCKTIICGSGNCSLWIMHYRGNADNIHQQLIDTWL